MGLNRIFECGYNGIHNQQYLRIDVFENEDLTFISPEPVDFGGIHPRIKSLRVHLQ